MYPGPCSTLTSVLTKSTSSTPRGLMLVSMNIEIPNLGTCSFNSLVLVFVSRMRNMESDDIHCLFLRPHCPKFGVFTVAYSNCGKQILAGANDGCLYTYDLVANRRVLMVPVAQEKHDVNAVGFLDESSNIFFSGTDNGLIRVSMYFFFNFCNNRHKTGFLVRLRFPSKSKDVSRNTHLSQKCKYLVDHQAVSVEKITNGYITKIRNKEDVNIKC